MPQPEVVIHHNPLARRSWACPNCLGTGNLGDGMASYSTTETRIRPATPCPLCRGKGRVKVVPFADDEA